LNSNLSLLPLPEDTADTPVKLEQQQGGPFQFLSPELVDIVSSASLGGRIAYIETEYWAGDGGQGAVVFCDAKLEYGPAWGRLGPINEALRLLGVRARARAIDEFATVGLGDHRTTEDWLKLRSGLDNG
jgi:hypothetical protein